MSGKIQYFEVPGDEGHVSIQVNAQLCMIINFTALLSTQLMIASIWISYPTCGGLSILSQLQPKL